MHVAKAGCITMVVLSVLTGCGAVRSRDAAADHPQVPSYAIRQTERSTLGDAVRELTATRPRESGFQLLTTGSQSFTMRLALIRAAEKTLDVQYYTINDDTTSNLLLEALIQAAHRGVRIRFLLDNINFSEVEDTFSVLEGVPNIEIRVFNPLTTRDDGLLMRAVKVVIDFDTMNHRMHNKSLIADNQMAIMGGRNLADEYFEENTDLTFRDLDIIAAGPVTDSISRSFDQFWNSKDAVPLGQLREPEIDTAEADKIRSELAAHWEKIHGTEKGKKLLDWTLAERLKNADIKLTWAKAELAADAPHKIDAERKDVVSPPKMRLDSLLARAKHEFVAVSPYFVPRDEGVKWLSGLVQRGMRVRVVTNSLASTDVVAVHTGYRRYREALVQNGIELYEMKPVDGKRPRQRLIGRKAPARASLHAKVYVVDRKEVMIGSFNLDPRSIELNTEMALVIHSPALAEQVIAMFDEVTSLETSYHVVEDTDESHTLVWKTREKEGEVEFDHDPHPGIWRGIQTDLMSILPIENQL